MKNPKIMNRIKEHYDIIASKGYEIVGIFLQGSQNYELDYEGSDVDTKAIVLPKFEDFVLSKKPISTTLELENKEHIDIKDIRLMFECFKKQNINFVEILFTKYFILNSKYAHLFRPMFENREQIAHYNNYAAVNCIAGMGLEKYKAMEHPYEGLLDKINKHGYDCKQLHHIIRMNEFIKRYISGEKYADCLISNNKDYLLQVKQNLHTLEEARIIAKSTVEELVQIKNNYMNDTQLLVDNHVDDIMKKVLIYIIKYNFQTEIGNIKRNKPKFIMMVGLPASGKSKIAEELSTLYKAKIHSSDEIRTELINDVNCQDMNAKVFELLHRRIKDDLRNGQSVIYDATNIHYKRRKAFIYELQRTDCEKRCVFVATPYEKCKIQNADRERSVPIEVINRMYKNIYIPQKYEGWTI